VRSTETLNRDISQLLLTTFVYFRTPETNTPMALSRASLCLLLLLSHWWVSADSQASFSHLPGMVENAKADPHQPSTRAVSSSKRHASSLSTLRSSSSELVQPASTVATTDSLVDSDYSVHVSTPSATATLEEEDVANSKALQGTQETKKSTSAEASHYRPSIASWMASMGLLPSVHHDRVATDGIDELNRIRWEEIENEANFNNANTPTPPLNSSNPTVNRTCSTLNDCASFPGYPYCLIPRHQKVGNCVQCNPHENSRLVKINPFFLKMRHCYCPIGSYCVGDPSDPDLGSCRLEEDTILGSPCTTVVQDNVKGLTLGENDKLFCGRVNYNNRTKRASFVEWKGVCAQGKCVRCMDEPLAPYPPSLCPDGRCCVHGKVRYAPAGIFDWVFSGYSPILPVFGSLSLMLLLISIIVAVVVPMVLLNSLAEWLKERRRRKYLKL